LQSKMNAMETIKIYIPSTSINSITVKVLPNKQQEDQQWNKIKFLKKRVKKKMGWPMQHINLVCDGKSLHDNDEIGSGKKIFALLTNFDELRKKTYFIYYKLFKQGNKHPTVFPLKVNGGMTLCDLKQALMNDGKLKLDDLSDDTTRIIHRGKLLSGAYCLMQESIKPGSNIVIFSRKRVKKHVTVVIKYQTKAGYNMLSETFDKSYMCGAVKLLLHHSKRIPSDYPPFIFLLKNERTGKVILDNESFEKQDVQENDCILLSYRGEPNLFTASGGNTLLSTHMSKSKGATLEKNGKVSNSKKNKRSKQLRSKNLFGGLKKGFFNTSKTRRSSTNNSKKKKTKAPITENTIKCKNNRNNTPICSTTGDKNTTITSKSTESQKISVSTQGKAFKPFKLKPINGTAPTARANSFNNQKILNKLSPIICSKNKENVYSYRPVDTRCNYSNIFSQPELNKQKQQVNMIKINDEDNVEVSLRDKITNTKQSIKAMKERIGNLQHQNSTSET
jgi:hypothetical protein